jgi:hypothetical protein
MDVREVVGCEDCADVTLPGVGHAPQRQAGTFQGFRVGGLEARSHGFMLSRRTTVPLPFRQTSLQRS